MAGVKWMSLKVLGSLLVVCLLVMMLLVTFNWKFTKQKLPPDTLLKFTNGQQQKLSKSSSLMKELQEEAEDKAVHICATVDEHHVMGFVSMVNSVWKNTQAKVKFHVLCSENIEKHLRKWMKVPMLKDIDFELRPFDQKNISHLLKAKDKRTLILNPMMIASYFYTEYFPKLKGVVLHIDSDVIVQGNVSELLHTRLDAGHTIAVVEDCISPSKRFTSFPPTYSSYINFQNEHVKALHFKATTCSFNTGVYVFNADLWRNQNITEKLVRWLRINTESNVFGLERGGGQAAPPLMLVFYKNYSKITDPMWNIKYLGLGTAVHFSDAVIHRGKLLHWSGPHKPWMALAQYKHVWDTYYVSDPLQIYTPSRRNN